MDSGRGSGRRGNGEKGRGGSRLGLKATHSPTPSAPPASSSSSPPPTFLSAPPARPSSSLASGAPAAAQAIPASSPAPSTVVPSSSPAGRASSPLQGAGLPPRPAQGARFSAIPPNFPSEQGNQHAQNLWAVYPPGGFTNLLQPPQYPSQPQMLGENFHYVGQTMSFNPTSPPPQPSPYGTGSSQTVKQGTSAQERVNQKVPTLILEAVASHDLWIWHAFFGAASSNNDINVLNQSTVFINELKGQAPRVQYMVNGNQHNIGYFLADGIYPEWAVFVKSIRLPITDKEKLYAQELEGARKDIERAFGVLQRRFCILKRPARLYDRAVLRDVVLACIILHNMIVEDEKERDIIEENLDLNEPPSSSTVQEPEFSSDQNVPLERALEKDTSIRDKSAHRRLKNDLIEHIWNKFGRHAHISG